jgi:hypothetical protein
VELGDVLFLGEIPVSSLVATTTVDIRAGSGPGSADPSTAPDITAGGLPQTHFVLVSPSAPDQFVKLTGALDVAANFDWVSTDPTHGPDDEDVDLLWCDDACAAYVGNFDGATGSRPENSAVSIPAATTWNLWANLYDGNGAIVKMSLTAP